MIRFRWSRPESGARARQLQRDWALRALSVAALLSVLPLLAVWLALPAEKPVTPGAARLTPREYSVQMNQKQLLDSIKASETAFAIYLKRDRAAGAFEMIARQFENPGSEGDLMQFLTLLGSAAGDDYFAVITDQQYQHLAAARTGAKFGVGFEIDYDTSAKRFQLAKVGPVAEAAGLKSGDELYSVNEHPAAPSDDPNRLKLTKEKLEAQMVGLVNTPVEVTVKRGGQLIAVTVRVHVVAAPDALDASDLEHPLDKDKVPYLKSLTVRHLRSTTVLTDLEQLLRTWQNAGVRGVVVDLRELAEGDGETAIRAAAMFREQGVLSRQIETTAGGGLVAKTWEIAGGKVRLTTRGPFKVGSDGVVEKTPSAPDAVEVKDWPTNLYRGPVVALVGRKTSGVGELLAASFSESWRLEKRGQTVAKFYSWGKGTAQTFFPIGDGYWLRLSTAFYLQPNGEGIEGELGPAPDLACPQKTDEWWFARMTLVERFNVVPLPEWPGASK